MTDLKALLDLATDRVEPTGDAAVALTTARRRARRSRGAVGVAVAATLLVAVITGSLATAHRAAPPVAPAPATPTPSAEHSIPRVAAPLDPDPASQPVWDPFDVVGAPLRPTVLPTRLEPPEAPEALSTMPAVVIAWPQEGVDLRLLGTDGRWRSVPGTRDAVTGTLRDLSATAISATGTQVALSTNDGLRVIDVTTGQDRTLAWPEAIAPPWDTAPRLFWLPGDDTLLALQWNQNWIVDLDGTSRRAPYRTEFTPLAVDPAGEVYENDYGSRTLLTWQNDTVVRETAFLQCERMVAAHALVACTAGSLEASRSGPVVVDPATGEIVAYAPVRDRDSVYSDNGYLTTVGFLDPDTLLLLVGPMDFRTMEPGDESWHIVAWKFRSGEFELVTSGGSEMSEIAVAPGLVD